MKAADFVEELIEILERDRDSWRDDAEKDQPELVRLMKGVSDPDVFDRHEQCLVFCYTK